MRTGEFKKNIVKGHMLNMYNKYPVLFFFYSHYKLIFDQLLSFASQFICEFGCNKPFGKIGQ